MFVLGGYTGQLSIAVLVFISGAPLVILTFVFVLIVRSAPACVTLNMLLVGADSILDEVFRLSCRCLH